MANAETPSAVTSSPTARAKPAAGRIATATANRDGRGKGTGEQRNDAAQVQVLQSVDVSDHAAEQVPAPVAPSRAGASGSMCS